MPNWEARTHGLLAPSGEPKLYRIDDALRDAGAVRDLGRRSSTAVAVARKALPEELRSRAPECVNLIACRFEARGLRAGYD
jgi:hypothetical protein